MKKIAILIILVLCAAALESCLVGPVVAPPPARVEVVGVAPGAGFIWIGGYWRWGGAEYVWVPGRWVRPRPGYVWVPGRWEQRGRRYVWHKGVWRRERRR
jgi:hypothetical protein